MALRVKVIINFTITGIAQRLPYSFPFSLDGGYLIISRLLLAPLYNDSIHCYYAMAMSSTTKKVIIDGEWAAQNHQGLL
jgi:hypothetical protein